MNQSIELGSLFIYLLLYFIIHGMGTVATPVEETVETLRWLN